MERTVVFQVIGSMWAIVIGLIFVWGAVKKWKAIVDPPDELWPFYTQSFYKKFIGKESLLLQTYIVGLGCLGAGLYYLFMAISRQ